MAHKKQGSRSGERPAGKFHYNPGNMSGKEAGILKELDKLRTIERENDSDRVEERGQKKPRMT